MGFLALFFIFLAFLPGQKSEDTGVVIETTETISETGDSYICATIDWWPQDKCNYNRCPWGSSSVINLNLSHPFLINAVKAFKNLRIRVGGSLQDQVIYDVGNLKSPCLPFKKENGGLFGFSEGCLHMNRWDEVNNFFRKTGVVLTFGLNALYGRHQVQRGVWGGDWDPSNAHDFIKYTISKGYHVDSWEFGNELSGKGVGARVSAELYGKDLIRLDTLINELHATSRRRLNSLTRPPLLAPGGFFDKSWFDKMLQASGPNVVNILSHHMYTLGSGNSPNVMSKILNPDHLNKASFIFSNLTSTIKDKGPWASAWVGESGGAYNNGARGISNTFVNSFWYLDQLGMAARHNTKVYCRQTLIGGFYGLLNKTTFVPNPDYYSALLWHRLMGKGVLAVNSNTSPYLRVYAHCAKQRAGITVLLINISNQTRFDVDVQSMNNAALHQVTKKRSSVHWLKRTVSWIGNRASDEKLSREEYHLTPKDGDLQSTIMLLNGNPLQLTDTGDIPSLDPLHLHTNSPLNISAFSIKFIVYPNFSAPGCE